MSKWTKKSDEENELNGEWIITSGMIKEFIKEWDELGSADAVLEKYGAARCEEIKIPDDLMPHVAIAGKHTGRIRKRMVSVLTYDLEQKNAYYDKYIRNGKYSGNDANIFQDWSIPARFFKRLEQRASDVRARQASAEKHMMVRLSADY